MNQIIEDIKPETIALIEAQAKIAGLSVDEYLRNLVGNGMDARQAVPAPLTREERITALHEWAASHDPNIPALALEDISRETIY